MKKIIPGSDRVRVLLAPYRGQVALLSFLSVISAVLQVLFALVSKYVVDTAVNALL